MFVGASLFCVLSSQMTGQETSMNRFVFERQRIIRLKKYQDVFNNAYKVLTGIIGLSKANIPNGCVSGGTAFNFADKKNKSYYISVYHVIDPPEFNFKKILNRKIIFYDVGGWSLEAKIEETLKEHDISILSSARDEYKTPRTEIIRCDDLLIGEEAYIIGYPESGFRTVTRTNVSAVITYKNQRYVVLSGAGNKGMSGSPVFVERNGFLKLAGILRLRDVKKNLLCAVPCDVFKDVLKKYL